ncbi:MAG: hypothetical protein JSV96_16420 [Candidatus Aminicenantes bacterium]|nr:MAG: hypothetical protein JSV96_16420 [Candidatus Aminicenantes bacterium]
MISRSNLNIFWSSLYLALFIFGLFSACAPKTSVFSRNGWSVEIDKKNEVLAVNHEDLGLVMKDTRLGSREDNGFRTLSKWTVKQEKDVLIINTKEPEATTWNFEIADERIDISCALDNALLQGVVKPSEGRIPARIESQDNGIMYTSLGHVSARNIYCLFDRETDILIQFSENCSLSRNPTDETLMNVALPVAEGTELSLNPDYYINVLGLKYYKPMPKRFKTAPAGWCSWYCYYMGTTEADMVKETDALAKYLKPYGMEYIQLDACFTRGKEASYLNWTKETFPKNGKWIFQYIKSKGLKPGLWVNAYGANYAHPECAEKYPENYFLRDKDGNLSSACCTADDTEVRLDYSNPEVIEKHLKPMFKILKDDWGLEYLKDAGWGTWIDYYDKNKERAFDPTKGGREIYVEVQEALRQTVGPDVFILGCAMHEVGLCFGIFDGSRTGGDDRAVWYPEKKNRMSMQTYFHSLFGANYLNNITWFCDPDTVMVRNPLTLEEARTVVSAIALTGQLYMASDFMWKLPPGRLDLYRKTIPTTPIVPIDLYPYKIESNKQDGYVWCCPKLKEFPRAIDLKVNAESGIYDVVSVFNWADDEQTKTISLEKDLGLDPEKEYLVFDFWNQKLKEKTKDEITSSIPAHGTCVYFIRSVLKRPQLLATSRHITGAVSTKKLTWDQPHSTLSGSSVIIEGAPYSIFIHVPEGMAVSKVDSEAEILFHKITGDVLEVRFAGHSENKAQNIINWTIKF